MGLFNENGVFVYFSCLFACFLACLFLGWICCLKDGRAVIGLAVCYFV